MRKLAICYAWEPPFAYSAWAHSCLNIETPPGYEMKWFRGTGWSVASMRTRAFEQALAWGADLICLTDADHVYDPDVMCRLVERHDKDGCDIVAPMIPMRGYIKQLGFKPFQKIGWRFEDRVRRGEFPVEQSQPVPINPDDGELQWAEMPNPGTLLFPARALVNLKRPWLYERIKREDFSLEGGGDTIFVRRLQIENDMKAWIDTTIEVKHLHTFEIDGSYTERFSDWAEPGVGDAKVCAFERGKRID